MSKLRENPDASFGPVQNNLGDLDRLRVDYVGPSVRSVTYGSAAQRRNRLKRPRSSLSGGRSENRPHRGRGRFTRYGSGEGKLP